MAVIRTSSSNMVLLKELLFLNHRRMPCFSSTLLSHVRTTTLPSISWTAVRFTHRRISFGPVRCAGGGGGGGSNDNRVSARLSQVQKLLQEAEERASAAGNEPPPPKITLDQVMVNFARSGGPGGQNVNKVNTKVDMRFNIKNAYWLGDRIRERIMQMEKNRINKDGEIVISSTRTRTQKGNIEDSLAKLQAIIDAASYVPPPPSEEQKKKIAKLAAIEEQNRLKSKRALSEKKAFRRSRESWD